MIRFIKPARSKHSMRGFFSYITESILNIHNASINYKDESFRIYFDLTDIPGYGDGNSFDICFVQDIEDYRNNFTKYINIESLESKIFFDSYNVNTFNNIDFNLSESIIKKYLVLNGEMVKLFEERHSQINFDKTIGFHRRATDMDTIHGIRTIPIDNIFYELEKEEFENIFLMCDNIIDLNKFKQRYGNRLITFDEVSTSNDNSIPFFKNGNHDNMFKKHIIEIVFGAYTLGMTKKLICTKSNLSTFSILSNSKISYKILN